MKLQHTIKIQNKYLTATTKRHVEPYTMKAKIEESKNKNQQNKGK